MVSACRAAEKALAALCADKLRSQIEGDVSYRSLYVLPKADVDNNLSASGYDPAVALAPGDAAALAKNLRADEYFDVAVTKTPTGFRVEAALLLQRDQNFVQPLGTFEHARIENAMQQLSRAYQDAHNRTFERQKDCFTMARERRYADAQKQIDAGLRDYPKSTWLRYCQLQIQKDNRAPAADRVRVAEELRGIDPASRVALHELAQHYQTTGQKDKYVEILMELLKADTTNAKLKVDIVDNLAAMGDFQRARPIAEKAVAENPGDLPMVVLYWRILSNEKDYKKAIQVGEEMVRMDEALADTAFFTRMIGMAQADSNNAKAAELASRAAAKFPGSSQYAMIAVNFQIKAGQLGQAIGTARRALQADPKAPNLRVQIAGAFLQLNQPDSALAVAQEMASAGEDKEQTAGIAVQVGNVLRMIPDSLAAKGSDAATKQAAWEKAYNELAWADTLAKGTKFTAQAKFLMGLAALNVGQGYLIQAGDIIRKLQEEIRATKPDAARQKAMVDRTFPEACSLTKRADEYLSTAQIALPAGGTFAADATRQLMGNLMQLNNSVEQMTKAYCNRPQSPGRP
jgi:predicted Zn-dependent protease